jgi:hypothetical protein
MSVEFDRISNQFAASDFELTSNKNLFGLPARTCGVTEGGRVTPGGSTRPPSSNSPDTRGMGLGRESFLGIRPGENATSWGRPSFEAGLGADMIVAGRYFDASVARMFRGFAVFIVEKRMVLLAASAR